MTESTPNTPAPPGSPTPPGSPGVAGSPAQADSPGVAGAAAPAGSPSAPGSPASAGHAVLEVRDLRKTYPLGRGRRTVACDDVSFTVPRGGALGVVGESGSGKTTLVRALVGLVRPDAGSITVAGRTRGGRERGRTARLRRAREVQMVFQDPYLSLDPRLTAADCLARALRLHRMTPDVPARARELLDRVGLGAREAGARPSALSGGQRQRLAIARALALEPAVLVLDEAVAALDVSIQAQILRLLDDVRGESALVFVSHDLAVVRQVTDDVLVMRSGRVVERGPTATVLSHPEHPYTRALKAAVPRPGWDPAVAAEA